jgi:organic hydroperoxide reductase OsmC/OhrA
MASETMRSVTVRAKELRYAVELTTSGELTHENGVGLAVPADWSPEHLLLAALVRCSLKSLRHHARRDAVDVLTASGSSRTLVTKRETDGRYALVETKVELAVTLEPEPEPDALGELLALAERDCFIGSSLTAEPKYRWTVNSRTIGS